MLSLSQSNVRPGHVNTATMEKPVDKEPRPAQAEPDAQEEGHESAALAGTETPITLQEDGTGAVEKEAAVQPQTESSDSSTGMEVGSAASKPSAPINPPPGRSATPGGGAQKANNQDKVTGAGKKYIPSKKAMVDPLKMDMSKQQILPPTSSLSLQCLECHIIFSDPKAKVRHMKLNHPAEYEQCILQNALFACYVCDRHFPNSTELMAHQKSHTEKKPYKCIICGQAFKKLSEYSLHKKVHFGIGGYECTDCGKPCKTMTVLRYHRRSHTGEKPYVCKECGKRFTMLKTVRKHMLEHYPEKAEVKKKGRKPKSQETTGEGPYLCTMCNGTFKTPKTRQAHMKNMHKVLTSTARKAPPAGMKVKQCTPIITPIPVCQPGLLQVEPNGPLQKVDANIDTEQICRLIESLGNVQKVNQVVVLGQVPPNAPPLEVQQISNLVAPVAVNLNPPQIDFIGQKQTESQMVDLNPSNNACDPMEQTIILEPITPDGQLQNSSFPGLAAGENIELTLIPTEHTVTPEGGVMPQMFQQPDNGAVQSGPMDQMMCQNEQDLEQTVILELTPALIPTDELEQRQSMPQNEIPPPTLVPTTELEKISDQTVVHVQETSLPEPPPLSTVDLELTPLQRQQQDLPPCPSTPLDILRQTPGESETNSKEGVDSQMQTVSLDRVRPVSDEVEPQETHKQSEQEPLEEGAAEKLLVNSREGEENTENLVEAGHPPSKEEVQGGTKQGPPISELPMNVMSAQELVKVRKRKPARLFYQGYMQELVGSIYRDDFQIVTSPAKRQRKQKSHLVVKFGNQNKEKINKKQKKPPQQQDVIRSKTTAKVQSSKKEKKGKRDKRGHLLSTAEIKPPSSSQDPKGQEIKEDASKNKRKKKKEVATGAVTSEQESDSSPVFKKKKQTKMMQKDPTKDAKDVKKKGGLASEEKQKTSSAPADVPSSPIKQDALLLLKGHKQPQLKVYKLDASKAPGQTHEAPPHAPQVTSRQEKNEKLKHPRSESATNLAAGKKKAGRSKKTQKSLLSSIQVSIQPPENQTRTNKPKPTRKRKASPKVETEGVITSSHSKRALECKDCGERFGEVSSLQKHKAMVHVVESPGLTYTNGNIFEGISGMDLYHLPKPHEKVVGVMNAATGWDTEPEMALEERDRSVCFPALNPSPSLPVPPADVEMTVNIDKDGNQTKSGDQSHTFPGAHSASDQMKNSETHPNLPSDEVKSEDHTPNNPSSEGEVHASTGEDIKEDLLLEVDLVTVGEQNEGDASTLCEGTAVQNDSVGTCNSEGGNPERVHSGADKCASLHTVSCSTQQMEIKDEEEEISVQKDKEGGKGPVSSNVTSVRGRGTGCLKRNSTSKRVLVGNTARQTEREQEECQVVYECHPLTSDSEKPESIREFEDEKAPPAPSLPPEPSASPEEQVVFQQSGEVMCERRLAGGEEQARDQSPGIIFEKFLAGTQAATAEQQLWLMTGQRQNSESIAGSEVQALKIKVEETIADPSVAAVAACQNRQSAIVQPLHHHDIRTVLVKEETRQVLNEDQTTHSHAHIRWNVEPAHTESTPSPFTGSVETTGDCHVTPQFNTSQCIFYPVKQEEREVLLEAARSSTVNQTAGISSAEVPQTEHQAEDSSLNESSRSAPDYQDMRMRGLLSEPKIDDFGEGQAEADADWQDPPDLQNFLLQSSDEEDTGGLELPDPHIDTEAQVMAYFHKTQTNSGPQSDEVSQSLPSTSSQMQTPGEEYRSREPIDFFSEYFGWDTWVEIASCTNKLSKVPNLVTAREVAQFVGIHIAMGTLKFPSPKLYWDNLTKVPLISEAMPLARFLEVSRVLKFASPVNDPVDSHQQRRPDSDVHCVEQVQNISSTQRGVSQGCDKLMQGGLSNEPSSSKTQNDPLWKAQPLLCHFRAGCQRLRRDGSYAVDQYPLPLTGKTHNSKLSLSCTTLIGFGGLLLHVDLKVGLSDTEDTVEKMAPKGSMVYLCKQELSTPAMLERLLVAGVHGAGRVGGARGQIGDEFVSSDGKLMLRRSHCGFILSTAGHSHRNMASLTDNFEKAQMSALLNRDLLNLYSIPLTASAPTCWPQAVLWYLTDLALVNSWLLYRQDHRAASAPLTLMAFRLEVSKALILSSGSDTQDSVPPQPPVEEAHATSENPNPSLVEECPLPDAATRYDGSGHWPEQLGEGEGGRCRFGDCQRTSRVLCLKCCVFLCISRNHNCFLNFHNQTTLGKD